MRYIKVNVVINKEDTIVQNNNKGLSVVFADESRDFKLPKQYHESAAENGEQCKSINICVLCIIYKFSLITTITVFNIMKYQNTIKM